MKWRCARSCWRAAPERGMASLLIGLVLMMIVVPGGLAGVVWLAGQAQPEFFSRASACRWPGSRAWRQGAFLPIVGDGDLWEHAKTLIVSWHAAGAFGPGAHECVADRRHRDRRRGSRAPLVAGDHLPRRRVGAACRICGALVWSLVIAAGVVATMAIAALALAAGRDSGRRGLRPLSILRAAKAW